MFTNFNYIWNADAVNYTYFKNNYLHFHFPTWQQLRQVSIWFKFHKHRSNNFNHVQLQKSAWKYCHADMAFLLDRMSLVCEYLVSLKCPSTGIIQGKSCVPPWKQQKPGGRLNKKDGLTRYGDSHVKDKTS